MFLDFKKWVKSIQTAGYNGARTVYGKSVYTVNLRYYLRFKFQFRHLICNEKNEIKICWLFLKSEI